MTIPQPPPDKKADDFLAVLLENGFQVSSLGGLNKFHRVAHNCAPGKSKAAYYIVHDEPFARGSFGCFRCGLKLNWSGVLRPLTPEEKAAAEKADELTARQQREMQEIVAGGLKIAFPDLPSCPPDHPYLAKKGIEPHGARLLRGDTLVIPLRDVGGKIWSAQGIGPDGAKQFERGGRIKGCFWSIGNLQEAAQILVCEGYATACTIHEATGLPVVAAMFANNLLPVCKAIRNAYPRTSITVCADSDRHTKDNPGLTAADDAALTIGAVCASPDFKGYPDDSSHTDFNDLARVHPAGKDRVKEIILAAVPPPRPVLHYNSSTGRWYSLNGHSFIQMDQGAVIRRLHISGISKFTKDGSPSAMDVELDRLMHDDSVLYAGPVAGWPRGVHVMNGTRVLVTKGFCLPEPGPGDYSTLVRIMEDAMGPSQALRYLLWLKVGRSRILLRQWHPHIAVALVGVKNSLKSFFCALAKEVLGGRTGKPAQFMQGITPFNSQLFGAEHLNFEDETHRRDAASRRHFGESLKSMLFCRDVECHPKHGFPVILNPFWAMTISLNDDPEHLLALPQVDDSLSDKLMILKCEHVPRPVPEGMDETVWLERLLATSMPAFLRFLDGLPEPEDVREDWCNSRTRLRAWQNPDIMRLIEGLSPELQLLNLIDDVLFDESVVPSIWTGTAEQLSRKLRESKYSREAEKLLSWPAACGVYLGRIAKTHPERISQKRTKTARAWSILPPGIAEF